MIELAQVVQVVGSLYGQPTKTPSRTFLSYLWMLQSHIGATLYRNWHHHHEITLIEQYPQQVHLLKKGIVADTTFELAGLLPFAKQGLLDKETLIWCGYVFHVAEAVLSCQESFEKIEELQNEGLFTEEEIIAAPTFIERKASAPLKPFFSSWWGVSKWYAFFSYQFDALMHCVNVYKALTFDPIAKEDASKRIFWNAYRVSCQDPGLIKSCLDYLTQTSSSSFPALQKISLETLLQVVEQTKKSD